MSIFAYTSAARELARMDMEQTQAHYDHKSRLRRDEYEEHILDYKKAQVVRADEAGKLSLENLKRQSTMDGFALAEAQHQNSPEMIAKRRAADEAQYGNLMLKHKLDGETLDYQNSEGYQGMVKHGMEMDYELKKNLHTQQLLTIESQKKAELLDSTNRARYHQQLNQFINGIEAPLDVELEDFSEELDAAVDERRTQSTTATDSQTGSFTNPSEFDEQSVRDELLPSFAQQANTDATNRANSQLVQSFRSFRGSMYGSKYAQEPESQALITQAVESFQQNHPDAYRQYQTEETLSSVAHLPYSAQVAIGNEYSHLLESVKSGKASYQTMQSLQSRVAHFSSNIDKNGYDFYKGYLKDDKGKNLSESAHKEYKVAKSADRLHKIISNIDESDLQGFLAYGATRRVSRNPAYFTVEQGLNLLIEDYGRAQTGAVISQDEKKFFRQQILGSSLSQDQRLANLRSFLDIKRKEGQSLGYLDEKTVSPLTTPELPKSNSKRKVVQ